MPKSRKYIFVLWGDQFEEVTATIFVAELRSAGLPVKIVGMTAQRTSGQHGLVLFPDLTLDEALPLAAQAMCVIVPYASPGLQRLKNDPRLRKFLERVASNKAPFVVGQRAEADLVEIRLFCPNNVFFYPESEALVNFARKLAGVLSSAIE